MLKMKEASVSDVENERSICIRCWKWKKHLYQMLNMKEASVSDVENERSICIRCWKWKKHLYQVLNMKEASVSDVENERSICIRCWKWRKPLTQSSLHRWIESSLLCLCHQYFHHKSTPRYLRKQTHCIPTGLQETSTCKKCHLFKNQSRLKFRTFVCSQNTQIWTLYLFIFRQDKTVCKLFWHILPLTQQETDRQI